MKLIGKMKRFTDIIFFNKDNKLLLLRRSDNCDWMPGKLCLPGGHLDEGLSLLQNAKKELEEEAGIMATHLTKIENHTFKTGDYTTIFYCFEHVKMLDGSIFQNCVMETGFPTLTVDEHSEYMFVTLKEFFDKKIQRQLMPEMALFMNEIFK